MIEVGLSLVCAVRRQMRAPELALSLWTGSGPPWGSEQIRFWSNLGDAKRFWRSCFEIGGIAGSQHLLRQDVDLTILGARDWQASKYLPQLPQRITSQWFKMKLSYELCLLLRRMLSASSNFFWRVNFAVLGEIWGNGKNNDGVEYWIGAGPDISWLSLNGFKKEDLGFRLGGPSPIQSYDSTFSVQDIELCFPTSLIPIRMI